MMKKEYFKFVSACHLFLINGNKILLLRRFNTGWEDGKYSVVAGHLDGNETVKTAMAREAEEEVGIDVSEDDLEFLQVMHRKSEEERIDFFFLAKKWSGDIEIKEPHKCDQLGWFNLDKLPENTIPYVRKAIENYKNQRNFDQFGWD